MKIALTRFALSVLPLVARSDGAVADLQAQVWQADIQIRTLEVTSSRSTMTARVVIYSEKDDEARNARLITNAFMLVIAALVARLSPVPPAYLVLLCAGLFSLAAIVAEWSSGGRRTDTAIS
jgi:hypothetical protein